MSGTLLCTVGLLLVHFSVSESVICYQAIDEDNGECVGFLGDGVPEEDCCLNIAYGFKRDRDSHCEACHEARWSSWSSWSSCTVSCLEGVQQRHRRCYGTGDCPDIDKTERLQTRSCIEKDCCPKAGGWSEWSEWGPCSVTCEKGIKKSVRQCNNPPPECDGGCEGSNTETAECSIAQVCPTHGNWGPWEPWGPCSGTCRDELAQQVPVQRRQRTCSNPPPSIYPRGNSCLGQASEQQLCSWLPFCPVDGNWGRWGPLSDCSVTCGVGRKSAKRQCNNPAPRYNGKDCPGSDITYESCTIKTPCPVDGRWTEWSDWKECARPGYTKEIKCKQIVGQQARNRNCEGRNHGGQPCEGSISEVRRCYNVQFCPYSGNGTWPEWSPWSNCKPPCGPSAKKSRTRICQPIHPDYPMTYKVSGGNEVPVYFWGTPRQLCVPINNNKYKLEEQMPCLNVPDCSED